MTTNRDTSAFPSDPTAFRPMKVTASRETPVGYLLEPVTKKMTLDKLRLFQGWPKAKNMHDDYESAHRSGFPKPIAMANQVFDYIAEQLVKFFGTGWVGGHMQLKVVKNM